MVKTTRVSELLATVPYAQGRAVEFYDDCVVFNSKQLNYEDITGYGYLLLNQSTSVFYIPILNSRSIKLAFSTGDDSKPTFFQREITNFLLLHSERQNELNLIFSELVKLTEVIIAPLVYENLIKAIRAGETVNIAGLHIGKDSVSRSGTFRSKEMEQYGYASVGYGQVVVKDGEDKVFFSASLASINAPLIKPILDSLFGG
jgi:hypothetical protein